MSLDSNIRIDVRSRVQEQRGIFTFDQTISKKFDLALTDGTATGKANRVYSAEVTLASGATQDVDLSGALEDILGEALAFVNVRLIAMQAHATNTTNVTIGNDAAAFVGPFGAGTHTLVLKPGDIFVVGGRTGYVVTATTADILQFTNAAGAQAKVDLVILGTDA